MTRSHRQFTAESTWGKRRARWDAIRMDVLRNLAAVLTMERSSNNHKTTDLLRDAFVSIYEQQFLTTRFACEGKPVYRFKKVAKEAGVGRVFRCGHCHRWHPGQLPMGARTPAAVVPEG